MRDPKLLEDFIQLRVQGLSVPKISEQIGVPASALYVSRQTPNGLRPNKIVIFRNFEKTLKCKFRASSHFRLT